MRAESSDLLVLKAGQAQGADGHQVCEGIPNLLAG